MKGSILKLKLKWLAIFEAILGGVYLLAFGISGSNDIAFHAFIIALSILIEPIIVVISYQGSEKSLYHHKDNTRENENALKQKVSDKRYKYVYGSRYEDFHVHF